MSLQWSFVPEKTIGIASTIGVVQLMRNVVHRKKSEGERNRIL